MNPKVPLQKSELASWLKHENITAIKHNNITPNRSTDNDVLNNRFNKEKIYWEEHLKWFSKKIQSPFCYYLVLEIKSNLVGSIRFDILDKIATISYLVAPDYHGQGIGNILFRKGLIALEKRFTMNELDTIQGFVFKDNIPSVKTFAKPTTC